MKGTRKYQHTFGRSAQTKVLDAVWDHRDRGINIRQLAKETRNSYFYTLTVLKDLLRRGLVVKETRGNQSLIRPNLDHPIVQATKKMPA
jgi:predicted transcriptional regulator